MRRIALVASLSLGLALTIAPATALTHPAAHKGHVVKTHKTTKHRAAVKHKVVKRKSGQAHVSLPKPLPSTPVSLPVPVPVKNPLAPAASPSPSTSPSAAAAPTTAPPAASSPSAAPSSAAPTTAAPTSQAPAPATTAPTSYSDAIGLSNGDLTLHGQPYHFTGVDAYGLATDYGHNAGCDGEVPDSNLDSFFASLRPDSLVRVWAFQAMAVNPDTKQLDWTGIDRVINAAAAHQQRLILTLGDQAGVCDSGHWSDIAWYQGDDTKTFNDDGRGLNIMSYRDWVTTIVSRYAGNPAVGMWEPLNEAEDANCDSGYTGDACYGRDSCPGGTAEVLRDWFTSVGGQIHQLDPTHLVSAGLLGMGECGQQNEYYGWIAASPGVDVMTIHDYDSSGDWDGPLNDRWSRAQAAGKPIILEEWGTNASDTSGQDGCPSLASRASILDQKLTNGFSHTGFAGLLEWHWEPGDTACSTEVTPGDPALAVLHDHAL